MIKVKGKYAEADIFSDAAYDSAIEQIQKIADCEAVKGSHIAVMPDYHAGAGCVIGTAMTIADRVIPNLVGVDIGCGMLVIKLKEAAKDINLEAFDKAVNRYIPAGRNIHPKLNKDRYNLGRTGLYWEWGYDYFPDFFGGCPLSSLKAYIENSSDISMDKAVRSLGTLGGGNHFIELDRDDEGNAYLVIHTGSRHLGVEVCKHYQIKAWNALTSNADERKALIEKYKKEGRQKEIQSALKNMPSAKSIGIPKELAYLEGRNMLSYLHDMEICQRYASLNRRIIAYTILLTTGLTETESFETVHNYIDINEHILRKGAISARKGEKVIIPLNMRAGSLICIGKGNKDWNCSAPHGAGRIMSRREARKQISMVEFEKSMEGIASTSVCPETADEAPMAYKPAEEIIRNIQDTCDIIKVIRPIYNFKAKN